MSEPTYELESLVTVGLFPTSFEAGLARAHLEAEGIRAFIADENFIHLYGSLATDGIKLQVREEDAPRARQLLADREPLPAMYLVTEDDEAQLLQDQAESVRQDDLVTVGRFVTPGEAHLVRSLLESHGIAACVQEGRRPAVITPGSRGRRWPPAWPPRSPPRQAPWSACRPSSRPRPSSANREVLLCAGRPV